MYKIVILFIFINGVFLGCFGNVKVVHECILVRNQTLYCSNEEYIDVLSAYAGYSHNWTGSSCTDIDFDHCAKNITSIAISCNIKQTCEVDGSLAIHVNVYNDYPAQCPGPANFLHIEYTCVPATTVVNVCSSLHNGGNTMIHLSNPGFPGDVEMSRSCVCDIYLQGNKPNTAASILIRSISTILPRNYQNNTCSQKLVIGRSSFGSDSTTLCSNDLNSNRVYNTLLGDYDITVSNSISISYSRLLDSALYPDLFLLQVSANDKNTKFKVRCGEGELPPIPTSTTITAVFSTKETPEAAFTQMYTTNKYEEKTTHASFGSTMNPGFTKDTVDTTGQSIVKNISTSSKVINMSLDTTVVMMMANPEDAHSRTPKGAIAGGIIAVLVVTIVAIVIFIIIKRGIEPPFPTKHKKGPTGFINKTYQSPTDPDVITGTPGGGSTTLPKDATPQYEDIDLVTGSKMEPNDYYNLQNSLHQLDQPTVSHDLPISDYDVIPDGGSVRSPDYDVIRDEESVKYETLPDGTLRFPNYETIPDNILNYGLLSESSSGSKTTTQEVAVAQPGYAQVDKTGKLHQEAPEAGTTVEAKESRGESVYDELKDAVAGADVAYVGTEIVDNTIYF